MAEVTSNSNTDTVAPAPDPLRIIDIAGLRRLGLDFCRAHLARLERRESHPFPSRFYPTSGRAFWVEQEVRQWLQDEIAQRSASRCRPVPNRKSTPAVAGTK